MTYSAKRHVASGTAVVGAIVAIYIYSSFGCPLELIERLDWEMVRSPFYCQLSIQLIKRHKRRALTVNEWLETSSGVRMLEAKMFAVISSLRDETIDFKHKLKSPTHYLAHSNQMLKSKLNEYMHYVNKSTLLCTKCCSFTI